MKDQPGILKKKKHKNQPGTMNNHKIHLKPLKTSLEPWKTNIEPQKTNLEPWKTIKTDLETWKTNLKPWKPIKTDMEPWKTRQTLHMSPPLSLVLRTSPVGRRSSTPRARCPGRRRGTCNTPSTVSSAKRPMELFRLQRDLLLPHWGSSRRKNTFRFVSD